jgi:hypothetical protein
MDKMSNEPASKMGVCMKFTHKVVKISFLYGASRRVATHSRGAAKHAVDVGRVKQNNVWNDLIPERCRYQGNDGHNTHQNVSNINFRGSISAHVPLSSSASGGSGGVPKTVKGERGLWSDARTRPNFLNLTGATPLPTRVP